MQRAARLSDSQYRGLLDLVGEAHDARDLTEFRAAVLPGVRRLVPADIVSYNEISRSGAGNVAATDPELPAWALEVWDRLASVNPLVQRFILTRDGRPYRFSDVVDLEAFHRSRIYRELYRPLGVEHQVAFALPSPRTVTIGIALNRGGTVDFGDDERDLLGLLRPHLIQAYRNARLRERSAAVIDTLRAGLGAHGVAAIVTYPDGRVALASERGRRLVREISGQELVDDRVPPCPVATLLADGPDRGSVRTRTGAELLAHACAPATAAPCSSSIGRSACSRHRRSRESA